MGQVLHGISRLPEVTGDKEPKRKFRTYPIGYFHVDIADVQTAEGKLRLFVAVDRTSKEATVKRYHYDSHAQLTAHLHDFIHTYNYVRRLKSLRGLTLYEYICKICTAEPERVTSKPHHQMPGSNT